MNRVLGGADFGAGKWPAIARRELSEREATTVVHGTREIEAGLRLVKRAGEER